MRWKTWLPGGGTSFSYVCFGKILKKLQGRFEKKLAQVGSLSDSLPIKIAQINLSL